MKRTTKETHICVKFLQGKCATTCAPLLQVLQVLHEGFAQSIKPALNETAKRLFIEFLSFFFIFIIVIFTDTIVISAVAAAVVASIMVMLTMMKIPVRCKK